MVVLISGTYYITSSASFKIPDNKNILIIGDSHAECAVDDNIFSRAVNVSKGGSADLYSYIKLRKFLDVNPHINKILMSFHGYSVTRGCDERTTGGKNIAEFVPFHFSLFSKEEVSFFMKINGADFFSAVLKTPLKSMRATLKFILGKNITYKDLDIGGYAETNRKKQEINMNLQVNFDNVTYEEEYEYSQYQLVYLRKIAELCLERNVELILINPPIFESEKYGNKKSLKNYYNNYFFDISYLDFSDFPLPENAYRDISHLNYRGAEIFSEYLENNYEFIFGNSEKYDGISSDN
jgi:hypothetical protein